MSVPAPWLATLVEQCLGSYLGQTSHNDIEVEDDGATLRFRKHGITSVAAVFEWALGSSHDSAKLIDAEGQILATFPHDLLKANLSTPNSYSNETSPKNHKIQLLDFAVVFTYSTSTPDVHLNIDRFRINWQEGAIKGLKPTKMLRRNKTVKALLEKAFKKAKSESLGSRSNGSVVLPADLLPRSVDQHLPQSQSRPQHDVQSQQVLSQIQSHGHDVTHQTLGTDRRLLHGANELLQRLGPSSRLSSRNSVGRSIEGHEETTGCMTSMGPLRFLADGEPTANDVRRSASPSEHRSSPEGSISSQPQDNTMNAHESLKVHSPRLAKRTPQNDWQGTKSPLPDSGEIATAQLILKPVSRSPSRKRVRESAEHQSEFVSDDSRFGRSSQGVKPDSPSRKKQRVEEITQKKSPEAVSSDQLAVEVSNSRKNQEAEPNFKIAMNQPSVCTNPWQGFSTIRAIDVNIPDDQRKLLEEDLCWIPPLPGHPEPHGHVPPWLLKQWNHIARLRHELKHEDPDGKTIDDSPETPSSSQVSSPASEIDSAEWPGSPVRSARNLPPESSPIRQPMSLRRQATPETSSQKICLDDLPQLVQSQENPTPLMQVTGQLSAPETSVLEAPLSNELRNTKSDPSINSIEDMTKDLDHSGDAEVQVLPTQLDSPRVDQAPAVSEERSSTDPDPSQSELEKFDGNIPSEDISDEDSVMENSIPFALGESLPPTQCSQAKEELRSEAHSRSQSGTDHVQVAVTPVVTKNRPQTNLDNTQTNPVSPHLQFSSQSNKRSSQSRVPNTYPYPGSLEKCQSSDDPTTSSSLCLEGNASRAEITMAHTQSSTNFQSQGTSDPSTHEVVLESSDPSQRYHDVAFLNSNSPVESSNHPFTSSAYMESSQLRDPIQEPMTQLSMSEPISLPHVSSSRLFDSSASSTYQSWSKRPLEMTENTQQIPPATPASQNAELVARRSGFICNREKSVEAQEVYKKFCSDYPSYAGDYGHFTELCSKLQAIRAQGLLSRSNLWDDFIIMHLQQYPQYLDSCGSQEIQSYESYFTSNFSKTVNRKRSLSRYTIEIVASQHAKREVTPPQASSQLDPPSQVDAASQSTPRAATPAQASSQLNPPSQTNAASQSTPQEATPTIEASSQLDPPSQTAEAMNTSLATSFMDRFSNFHAHSPEEPVNHSLSVLHSGLPAVDSHPTSSMDTGSSSVLIKLEGSEGDPDEILCTQTAAMDPLDDIPTLYNPQLDTAESHPPDIQSARARDEQDEQDDVHPTHSQSAISQDERDDVSMGEVEETDNEEFDPDDTRHETASVELGDETFISATSQSHADEVPETQPERGDEQEEEEEGENWFVSMRHIWSRTEPVWSDHPTTPFKRWAEADQNVLSERRRRGGGKVILDEKGVIRRTCHR
ncbi:hypothetical protein F1880_000632 [Penicillium rolfsii]|nr:hypothetical protein F1880_000632 [Penicillium rolfsii]